ncbi:alpha/beta hydrolase [Nocardia sp. NPDC003183]
MRGPAAHKSVASSGNPAAFACVDGRADGSVSCRTGATDLGDDRLNLGFGPDLVDSMRRVLGERTADTRRRSHRRIEPSPIVWLTGPVVSTSTITSIRTLDGLHLAGTIVTPDQPPAHAALLVHGGGVTCEEGGFFTRLADGLAESGVASLRFDLRAHGESDGRPEESSLAAHLNDIRVALGHLSVATNAPTVHLVGTSFGGGLAAYYAAKHPAELTRLVLLNPQLNYKNRYIDHKQYWVNDFLSDEKAAELRQQGYLNHSATVKHSRTFLNEVFWIQPNKVIGEIQTPTLVVHGTKDTFVPVETSREAVQQLQVENRFVEIDGAQHGFAVHDDPQYLDPQSQQWQAFVIRNVAEWLTDG